MKSTRGHADGHVTNPNPIWAKQILGINNTRTCASDVIFVRRQQARMLSRLPAHEGTTCQPTPLCNSRDDRSNALGYYLARCNVVGHKQRLSTTDDKIVDNHGNQINPDRVVLVHALGDDHLGTDSIGGGGQKWALVSSDH